MSENGGQRKARRELLKQLRDERSSQVKAANAANAAVRSERKQIVARMGDTPVSVCQVAVATGMPTDRVLWHIAAMRKYGQIAEAPEKDGDYYTYVLTSEGRAGGGKKAEGAKTAALESNGEASEEG